MEFCQSLINKMDDFIKETILNLMNEYQKMTETRRFLSASASNNSTGSLTHIKSMGFSLKAGIDSCDVDQLRFRLKLLPGNEKSDIKLKLYLTIYTKDVKEADILERSTYEGHLIGVMKLLLNHFFTFVDLMALEKPFAKLIGNTKEVELIRVDIYDWHERTLDDIKQKHFDLAQIPQFYFDSGLKITLNNSIYTILKSAGLELANSVDFISYDADLRQERAIVTIRPHYKRSRTWTLKVQHRLAAISVEVAHEKKSIRQGVQAFAQCLKKLLENEKQRELSIAPQADAYVETL